MNENLNRFTGKNILLTGGARGIGRAIAVRLGSEGANVAIHDVSEEECLETLRQVQEAGGKGKFFYVDVSDYKAVQTAIKDTLEYFENGRIDCMACNAGVNRYKHVFEFTNDDWEFIMGINATGVWNYNRYVGEVMAKQGGGIICNTSSIGAWQSSYMRIPYMASKGAVKMLTQAFAQDLGDYNIRVNAIEPSATETNMTRPDEDRPGVNSRALVHASTSLRRYAVPEDQAAAVAFLLSDDAAYINGASLTVDGGTSAGNMVGLPILPMPKKGHFDEVPWLADFDYVKEYRAFCEAQEEKEQTCPCECMK